MTDEKTLQQIANQLLPRYRLFLVTGQGGGSLTQQEREMLVKIRDNANNVQLEELQPYVNRNVTDSMVASRSYGFLATILDEYSGGIRETYWGANAPREEVSITSPGLSFVPEPEKPAEPLRYPMGKTHVAIANVLQPKYRNYFLSGSGGENLSVEEREFLNSARANPFRFDISDYQNYVDGTLPDYTQRYQEAKNAIAAGPQDKIVSPEPVSTTVLAEGAEQAGIVSTTRIGEGAPEIRPSQTQPRPFGTGAEDIEPGEAARLGADVGMVGSVTIQPGGDAGGDAGGGTGGGTGAGGDGVGGGGVGVETPYDDSVPEDWKQAASEIYGAYYSIINQNPEVAELIARAEAEKWGPEKFDYELEQTTWWKTTSLATRTFDIEMQRDPATVQARIDALSAQIREDALSLNIRLTGETLNTIATEAIRQGWTEQQVTIALGDEAVKSQAGVTGLRYGYYGNKINEIAASYGVSVSDLEFSQLVEKFALGRENEESLTSAFQTRATALFPAISERLMAGETFADIVEPYRNRASQILGQDFSASDFMDNDSFAQAVTFTGDDGKQRPMTYTEWGQYLRSNREFGYEYTDEAQGRAYQVANRIADIFGAI